MKIKWDCRLIISILVQLIAVIPVVVETVSFLISLKAFEAVKLVLCIAMQYCMYQSQ